MPSWLIGRVALRSHRLVATALATAGSSGHDFRLLATLAEAGSASQAALARATGIDRSDVVGALGGLVGRGLVERGLDPVDGRRNVVAITRAGRSHLRRLDALLAGVQAELLAPLAPREREQLVGLLHRVVGQRPEG